MKEYSIVQYSTLLVHSSIYKIVTVPHLHFVHAAVRTPQRTCTPITPPAKRRKQKKNRILDVFGNAMHELCGQGQPSQRVLRAIEVAGPHCSVWSIRGMLCMVGRASPRPAPVQCHYSPTVNAQLRAYGDVGTTTFVKTRDTMG